MTWKTKSKRPRRRKGSRFYFAVHTSETEAPDLVALVKPEIDIQPAYDALAQGNSGKVYVHGKGTAGQQISIYEVAVEAMMESLRFRFTPLHPGGLELHKKVEQLVRPK